MAGPMKPDDLERFEEACNRLTKDLIIVNRCLKIGRIDLQTMPSSMLHSLVDLARWSTAVSETIISDVGDLLTVAKRKSPPKEPRYW